MLFAPKYSCMLLLLSFSLSAAGYPRYQRKPATRDVDAPLERPMTNAERFARGLPPSKPRRRSSSTDQRGKASPVWVPQGSPTAAHQIISQTSSSPSPSPTVGNLQASNSTTTNSTITNPTGTNFTSIHSTGHSTVGNVTVVDLVSFPVTPYSTTSSAVEACPIRGYIEWSNGLGYMDNGMGDEYANSFTYLMNTHKSGEYGVFGLDPCAPGPVCVQCYNCAQSDQNSCLGIQQDPQYCGDPSLQSGTFGSSCLARIALTPAARPSSTSQSNSTLYDSSDSSQTTSTGYQSAVWLHDNSTGLLTPSWVYPNQTIITLSPLAGLDDSGEYYPCVTAPTATAYTAPQFTFITFTFVPFNSTPQDV